ncbi:hypothetical protein WA026_006072 [Henosepilachna vigintioctopunctata]|uniref:Uncharacterized protein n=1 Tax=Henosepilachna vigintioctopunctata TaxID=420089 RepID=A0AAW1TQD4_9CUCU
MTRIFVINDTGLDRKNAQKLQQVVASSFYELGVLTAAGDGCHNSRFIEPAEERYRTSQLGTEAKAPAQVLIDVHAQVSIELRIIISNSRNQTTRQRCHSNVKHPPFDEILTLASHKGQQLNCYTNQSERQKVLEAKEKEQHSIILVVSTTNNGTMATRKGNKEWISPAGPAEKKGSI